MERDDYYVLEIVSNYLLNTTNTDDIDILIKISTLSKYYYEFLSDRLIYHKAYIRSRLKYLPIIQPKFYKYSFKPIPESDLYTPLTLIKYFGRSKLSIDEIIDFNVYLVLNCKQYSKTVHVDNDCSVYGINPQGRIIQLPTHDGCVGGCATSNILNDQIIMRITRRILYRNNKLRYEYFDINMEFNFYEENRKLPAL